MDRHKGGVYICTANNGVGQPASSQVILHVLCKYANEMKKANVWIVITISPGQIPETIRIYFYCVLF